MKVFVDASADDADRRAYRCGKSLRRSRSVEIVRIDDAIEDDAWSILGSHADKRWSYVDATSFALMSREGTVDAFSLDRHFRQRGLNVLPDR